MICEASRKGDIEDVKLHLRQGADVNTTDGRNDFTALHWAVNVRNAGMTELLLEHGLDRRRAREYRVREGITDGVGAEFVVHICIFCLHRYPQ